MSHSSFNGNRDVAAFRGELRRRLIAAREALAPHAHRAASAAIEGSLEALLSALPLSTLAFCWPFRAEFDARPLVTRLLKRGLRAALPVVVDDGAPLLFRAWTPDSAMSDDRYGIHIPVSGEPLAPELILMPVNAFDAQGFRLGYGGGYFDRTLAAATPRPLALGVGFELARVDSIRPQEYDLRMDAIVTEAGIFLADEAGLRGADAAGAAAALEKKLP
ncbi:MAG: 5-formyltetrahydrofolate cyclo-ligase [Pseudomonadota bacterium]